VGCGHSYLTVVVLLLAIVFFERLLIANLTLGSVIRARLAYT